MLTPNRRRGCAEIIGSIKTGFSMLTDKDIDQVVRDLIKKNQHRTELFNRKVDTN